MTLSSQSSFSRPSAYQQQLQPPTISEWPVGFPTFLTYDGGASQVASEFSPESGGDYTRVLPMSSCDSPPPLHNDRGAVLSLLSASSESRNRNSHDSKTVLCHGYPLPPATFQLRLPTDRLHDPTTVVPSSTTSSSQHGGASVGLDFRRHNSMPLELDSAAGGSGGSFRRSLSDLEEEELLKAELKRVPIPITVEDFSTSPFTKRTLTTPSPKSAATVAATPERCEVSVPKENVSEPKEKKEELRAISGSGPTTEVVYSFTTSGQQVGTAETHETKAEEGEEDLPLSLPSPPNAHFTIAAVTLSDTSLYTPSIANLSMTPLHSALELPKQSPSSGGRATYGNNSFHQFAEASHSLGIQLLTNNNNNNAGEAQGTTSVPSPRAVTQSDASPTAHCYTAPFYSSDSFSSEGTGQGQQSLQSYRGGRHKIVMVPQHTGTTAGQQHPQGSVPSPKHSPSPHQGRLTVSNSMSPPSSVPQSLTASSRSLTSEEKQAMCVIGIERSGSSNTLSAGPSPKHIPVRPASARVHAARAPPQPQPPLPTPIRRESTSLPTVSTIGTDDSSNHNRNSSTPTLVANVSSLRQLQAEAAAASHQHSLANEQNKIESRSTFSREQGNSTANTSRHSGANPPSRRTTNNSRKEDSTFSESQRLLAEALMNHCAAPRDNEYVGLLIEVSPSGKAKRLSSCDTVVKK